MSIAIRFCETAVCETKNIVAISEKLLLGKPSAVWGAADLRGIAKIRHQSWTVSDSTHSEGV